MSLRIGVTPAAFASVQFLYLTAAGLVGVGETEATGLGDALGVAVAVGVGVTDGVGVATGVLETVGVGEG